MLSFTYEKEIRSKLPFLDVCVTRSHSRFLTNVHVKHTNTGECINYHSIAPERYKTGVIKTLLHRATKVCSDRTSLGIEIARIKQLLCNNNFPMNIIETECEAFMRKKIVQTTTENADSESELIPVNLFCRNQMTSQYAQDERNLNKILASNVKPAEGKTISLHIYYKNKKLKQLFVKNNPHKSTEESHVVYRYVCPREECQPSQNGSRSFRP